MASVLVTMGQAASTAVAFVVSNAARMEEWFQRVARKGGSSERGGGGAHSQRMSGEETMHQAPKCGARLDEGEPRVAARAARPVVDAHLQRVGEGPAVLKGGAG